MKSTRKQRQLARERLREDIVSAIHAYIGGRAMFVSSGSDGDKAMHCIAAYSGDIATAVTTGLARNWRITERAREARTAE